MRKRLALIGVLATIALLVLMSPSVRSWTLRVFHSSASSSAAVVPPKTDFDATFHTLKSNMSSEDSATREHTQITRIQVNINRWTKTPYNTEVFMFLTISHTPVSFIETYSNVAGVQGQSGYMQLLWPQVNDFLARHQLATIQDTRTEDQVYYQGPGPGVSVLWADTKTPVPGNDWRLVIVATANYEKPAHPVISWIKVLRPNVKLNDSELNTPNES